MEKQTKKQKHLTHLQYSQLIAHAWKDDAFRERLEKDPTATIREFARERFGVHVEHAIMLPPRPDDLADEHLHDAAHGNRILEQAPKTSTF